MNTKSLIASAAATLAAATLLSSTADAGFKIGIGIGIPLGGYSHHHHAHKPPHWRQRTYVERKTKRARVVAKKKPTEPSKQEVAAVPAENENSSISVAALPVNNTPPAADASVTGATPASPETATPANPPQIQQEASVSATATGTPVIEQKPDTVPADGQKTGKRLDCRKFFPSVGMTLSVPCE